MPVVEDEGTFTVRGSVVDFFPPVYRFPVRLELDGDEILSLRLYDPETQRTLRTVEHVYIHPVRETVVTEGAAPRERLLAAADAASHPSSRTRFILSQIEEGSDFFGSEALVSIFHRRLAPLWEYLPEETFYVLDEPEALVGQAEAAFAEYGTAYRERLENHQLAVDPAELFVTPDRLAEQLGDAIDSIHGFCDSHHGLLASRIGSLVQCQFISQAREALGG